MANFWNSIDCLICGSNESNVLFKGSSKDWQDNLEVYFSSSRTQAVYGQIVRCKRCGFIYANPQLSPIELARIYLELTDKAYASEEVARIIVARRSLDIVEKWYPQHGKLLDIGCSTGIFLKHSEENGWRSFGIEPSFWALTQCQQHGVLAYQGVAESIALAPETFDVITLWDVLEHSIDPRRVLQSVHQILKNDGLLFINVPNIESMTARLLGSHWPLLLLEHLWYFSPSTLGRLLGACSFQLLATMPHEVTFSLDFILARMMQQGILPSTLSGKIKALGLNRLHLSFTMGEMTVVARKVENLFPANEGECTL